MTFAHYYAFVRLYNKHKVTRFNNIPFWSVTKRERGKFLYICFRKTYSIYMYRDDDIYNKKRINSSPPSVDAKLVSSLLSCMLLITTYNFVCNHTIVENEWRIICSMVNVCVKHVYRNCCSSSKRSRSEGVLCWDFFFSDIICILQVLLEGFSVNWLSSRQFTLASFQVGDRCIFSNIYVCSLA